MKGMRDRKGIKGRKREFYEVGGERFQKGCRVSKKGYITKKTKGKGVEVKGV